MKNINDEYIKKEVEAYFKNNYYIYDEITNGNKWISVISGCGKDILKDLFYNVGWVTCPFCNKKVLRREKRK